MKRSEIRKLCSFLLPEIDKHIIKNPEYKKTRKKCNKLEDELKEFIGKEGYKKFENFMDEYTYLSSVANEEYFIHGFSKSNKFRDESLSR